MAETGVVCPFCGLLCDDLAVAEDKVDARGCPKGAAGFARMARHLEHRVAGRAASLDEAAAAAAALLREARQPLVTGLAADVDGVRALLGLADRLGGVVDRWGATAQMGNLAVSQSAGALTATFGEVANRADVVVLIGRDPARAQPRFFERLIHNAHPLYRAAPPWIGYLGPAEAAPRDAAVTEHATIDAPLLIEALGALALALRASPGASSGRPELSAAVAPFAQRLAAARYGVLVWEPAAFDVDADLAGGMLLHVLRLLNRRARCVGLPLAGDDNAQGVAQAMLWQTGWPLRVSFAAGVPEHDPWRQEAERLVAAGEADALLWVAALNPLPPPATAARTVALVAADVELAREPEVTIRVGIPGLDHAGTVVRADTVIALPLAALRPSPLPSVAAAARAILGHLGGAEP